MKDGLQLDKYIIIPKRGGKDVTEKTAKKSWLDKLFNKVDSTDSVPTPPWIVSVTDSSVQDSGFTRVDIGRSYKVCLMLPFDIPLINSMHVDSLGTNDSPLKVNGKPDPSRPDIPELSRGSITSLEFYNGLLLAVDSMGKQGMPLELNVFDTRNDRNLVRNQLDSVRKIAPDLVIGPLFKNNVEYVAGELEDDGVFVISPLSRTVSVEGHANLLQIVPDEEAIASKTASVLNKSYKYANVIFAQTGAAREGRTILKIKSHMLAREDGSYMGDVTFTDEMLKRNELGQVISESKQNVFVVISEDQVFLSDLVNKLRQLRDTSIRIIAPHRVLDMRTLESAYLDMLKLTMVDPDFVDYKDSTVMAFVGRYRERFDTEPSRLLFRVMILEWNF